MANVLMTFAEYEREVIGARVKDAYDKLVSEGKYTGGLVPFGYRPVKLAKNWGYEPDPEYAPLVAEMADRYLRYETLGSIAKWLQESGVPSPRDSIRKRNGKKPIKGTPWSTRAVRLILGSPAILGAVANANGEALRDSQGLVVYRAAPLITRDVYEKVQARLSQNAVPVRINSTPLLQVAVCSGCGGPMHRTTSKTAARGKPYEYNYYLCYHAHMRDGKCSARRVKAKPLEDAVFSTLFDLAGHRKLRTERLVPGRDYSEESARLIEQTQHLQAEIGRARLQRKDYSELQATLDAANAELDRLAALDPIPARLEYDETDQTFREWWELNDQAARNAFLREQGVRAVVSPDRLPSIEYQEGPLTALDITKMAIIDRPGMHVVIYLGNLGDLLRRASDLSITVRHETPEQPT